MSKFKVIGGFEGCYQPSYSSTLMDKEVEAVELLIEKLREEREFSSQADKREVIEESIEKVKEKESFSVYRGERAINMKYEVVEIEDTGIIKSEVEHQANRMY